MIGEDSQGNSYANHTCSWIGLIYIATWFWGKTVKCCIDRLHLLSYANHVLIMLTPSVAYPGIFFRGGSTNSVEDRGQRGGDLGAVAP